MAELMVLGYRFGGHAKARNDPKLVSEVFSSIRLLGTVVDAVWFGWTGAEELTLRSTDEARGAAPEPGIVRWLLAVALPGAVLRPDVDHETDDDEVGRPVRRVLELLGPHDTAALATFVEDARQGLLAVLLSEPGGDIDEGSDDENWIRLRVKVDEPSLVEAIRFAATGREAVTAADAQDRQKPSVTAVTQARVLLDPANVWRAGLVVLGLVIVYVTGAFILEDGGLLIFQVVMAFLASIAMEPAVSALTRHMRRGLATAAVMAGVVVGSVGFFLAFGNLLAQQVSNLALALPAAVENLTEWANRTLGLSLDPATLASTLNVSPADVANISAEVAGGMLGFVAKLLGGIFSMFTIGLFIFYFSADAPRLKRWVARLLTPRDQEVFVTVWDLAVQKTGGYVAARIVLAGICAAFTSVFLLLIGMDYWLALGLWTGVVSQFVPTIGTYIAIALPVIVGLTSDQPVDGVLALVFALVYQQIENLTIEPRISADAVDLHPAVSFASVLLGAALFGVGGALVAVPVAALGLALFQIYSRHFELVPELGAPESAAQL